MSPLFYMQLFTVGVLGLCLGSFATAIAWRAPRGEGWFKNANKTLSRSVCPSCNATLTWKDLVPVFSWVFAAGKCRHCKKEVAAFYPLTEIGLMLASIGVFLAWGMGVLTFTILAALPFLAALLIVDSRHFILPDKLLVILGVLGGLFLLFKGYGTPHPVAVFTEHILGAGIYAFFLWLIGKLISVYKGKDALGFGDVKFMLVAGLWLGVFYMPMYFMLSGLLGVVWGIFWRLLRKEDVFPFGPALIISLYISLLMQGSDIYLIY